MVEDGQRYALAVLSAKKRYCTNYTGDWDWVSPRAVLNGSGKKKVSYPTGFLTPVRPARSESP